MSEPDLRARLVELRDDALHQLAEGDGVDAGLLRIAVDVGAVLAALGANAVESVSLAAKDWAIVQDDNQVVRIIIYAGDRQAARVTLAPAAAIRLAGQLLAAGVRRL